MTLHPELMESLLEAGRRDVDLLNAGSTGMVLRVPYADLDEPVQLADLFRGSCGTDAPIVGVLVLPPIAEAAPPTRVPLGELEMAKWKVIFDLYVY